ncbi:hypothetical protein [Luteimonas pelagia]
MATLIGNARLAACLCLVALLAACTTSHVLTGTPRPPIDPAHVRFYFDTPPAYEEIARLSTSSGSIFGAQSRQDAVLRKLRDEAAALGANGVLLVDTVERGGGGGVSIGAGGGSYRGGGFGGVGIGVLLGSDRTYAEAVAIHVPAPPAAPAD